MQQFNQKLTEKVITTLH